MKLFVITTSDYFSNFPPGGVNGYLKSILPSLKEIQISVYGFAINRSIDGQVNFFNEDSQFISLRNIKYPSLFPLRLIALLEYLKNRKKILGNNPDVIYVQSWESALPFLFNKTCPVVFHQHGSENPLRYSKYKWARNSIGIKLFDWILKVVYRRADKIIAIDNLCYEQATRMGAASKTFLMRNAIDTNLFNGITASKRIQENRILNLLFVGRLEEVKQVDLLIKSVEILRYRKNITVKLKIAGTGSCLEQLKSLSKELKLEQNVVFLGNIERDQLPNLYRAADCLVLPSKIEGTPMVILESLACGTPVVASDVGGIGTLVKDKHNGLLIRWVTADVLAEALMMIKTLCFRKDEIISSVQMYRSEKAADHLLEIFKEVSRENDRKP